MKKILILLIFSFYLQLNAQPIISDNGHPEHLIAGVVIGAGISYWVYKKTDNKLKAWFIGTASAAAIGYIKEAVDPKWLNGVRSNKDIGYTALGGVIGASIVIPLKRRKSKETPNIAAAFK
jgi:hypothetical protein